jgi:ferritin
MLSDKLQNAINEQIKNELYSAYLYLAMSAHFESISLPGFAKWTRIQAKEETGHAMKFFDFVNDRGGHVELKAIDAPPSTFGEPLEIYKEILAHERKVTAMIYKLYEVALAEKDYPAQVLLQWYINEQVEEEKNACLIVDQLQMAEDRRGTLVNLDHHVGKRGE